MKRTCTFFLIFLPLFLLSTSLAFAQNAYFQQEVNYKIKGTLDDQQHLFTGEVEISYTNNSPDALTFIYFHLWANSFRDRNTAFARQKVRQGSSRYYFAKDKDLGNYSGLEFTVDKQPAALKLEKDNPDIAILTLPKELKPGETITIHTPFALKIPASFSRLGHVGESYQMTQWYPKPAVYDREGWHPMPYLDMGEFYSEFGAVDVEITLPKNYIVAATGVLQTTSEVAFLNEEIEKSNRLLRDSLPTTDNIPPSDAQVKTIRFSAENVHDFAWFADKRFYVQKSNVTLASGRKVDTWVFFTNAEGELWKEAISYVDRATVFYSEKVGEYPYPHATAVQSALSAGGGMEYPMITVIGLAGSAQPLDEVITHEVGHNWFYGILGFDERKHGWLDEGINSYYDHRYTEKYYKGSSAEFLPKFLLKKTDYNILELAYLYQARRNLDQAPETDSDDFGRINYFLGIYEKPAVVLKYLEKYLGTARFDKIMHSFYKEWEFKHPAPEDFRRAMTEGSGENLDWFFEGFINSNKKMDYALTKVKKKTEDQGQFEVTVANRGAINAPFALSGLKGDEIIKTQWYPGFSGQQKFQFPSGDYDKLVIDAERVAPDLYRKNNTVKLSGLFPAMAPIKFKFPLGLEHSEHNSIFVTPLVSWNNYDKTMLGLALYNSPIPAKRFEYVLAPMYSFVNGDLNGTANLQYHFYTGNKLARQITFELGLKRFNYSYNWPNKYYLQYTRLVPAVKVKLATKASSSFSHYLQYRAIILEEERPEFSRDSLTAGQYLGNKMLNSLSHELVYAGRNNKAINPWSYKLTLEQQNYEDAFGRAQNYLKASLELNSEYTYDRGKSVNLRLFAGGFFSNSRRNAGNFYDNVSNRSTRGTFGMTYQGFLDDKYDGLYFGRSEDQDIWSQQIEIKDGGMKNAFGSSFGLGLTNSYLITANLKADLPQALPFKLPLKPYFDIGFFKNATPIGEGSTIKDQTLWSGGILLEWFDGNLAIYFPIANSKNMENMYKGRGSYLTRITYTLNLNALNPFELVNNLSF